MIPENEDKQTKTIAVICVLIFLSFYIAVPLISSCRTDTLRPKSPSQKKAVIEMDSQLTKDQRFEKLYLAVAWVESRNNPTAYNKKEDARGILQIRAIMVKDVNRILGEETFVHDDAYDPKKARKMFEVFLNHYWSDGSLEQWARSWNGGPKGPDKEATLHYWGKVQEAMLR